MTREAEIAVRQIAQPDFSGRLSELLRTAFAVTDYTASFPHIFSPSSAARKFAAFDPNENIIACCAVDTEIWSEPQYLRGGCIGSVAVDPKFQRRGFGRRLLTEVISQLRAEESHDFLYLFSDQPEFYESLGFRRAGTEILSSFSVVDPQPDGQHIFRQPLLTTVLGEDEKVRLWRAFERGRLRGESSSSFAKFCQVLEIPEMCVSWIEDSQRQIAAGVFVGKGVDFRGVAHSFFAENSQELDAFLRYFRRYTEASGVVLQIAAGLRSGEMSASFSQISRQDLCLVYGLTLATEVVVGHFEDGKIYPRALFSS
ncbi:MAG: Acetyltransferase domain [Pseudomonadota bacterium]|jgi:predicted N-acetyltransferase YhbS